MNDQLRRIKDKDYSQIDQKLFENMLRADNLNSTFSHLSQFQQFLMNQIANLNQPDQKSNNASLRSSITRNFDTLRESLVKCSKITTKGDGVSSRMRMKIASLQNQLKKTKESTKKQIKDVCKQTKSQAECAMNEMIVVIERQRSMRKQLELRCIQLVKEKQLLMRENINLKSDSEIPLTSRGSIQKDEKPCFSAQTSKFIQYEEQSPIVMSRILVEEQHHLKEKTLGNILSIPSFSDKDWKLNRGTSENRFSTGKSGTEPKRHSLSRQNSSHKLSSKQNFSSLMEQHVLLKKGVRQERGKSKQKIKIFSMM